MESRERVGWLRWVLMGSILAFLMIPVVFVIPMSFTGVSSFVFPPPKWSNRWWLNLIEDERWREAAWLSLRIAVVSCLLTTIAGTMAAYALVRSKGRWVGPVRAFIILPQVVPIVVVGIGALGLFLRLHLVGTFHGFVVAHSALALPFVVIPVAAALDKVDPQLERAAAVLGSPPLETFRRIVLPLILPGVLAGAYFAFSLSFGELVVSLFISTPKFTTLPVFLWQQITDNTNPTVAVLGTIQISIVWTFLLVKLGLDRIRGRADRKDDVVELSEIGGFSF